MWRVLLLLVLILSIVGCGNGSASSENSATSASSGSGDGTAVNMQMPEQKIVGKTTLADACDKAGMKPYPGSEKAEGNVIDRGNGEIKEEITFTTSDSIEKVGTFFKEQGLDSKNGSAMGMTKVGASIIVSFEKSGDKTKVVFKSVRAAEKKP